MNDEEKIEVAIEEDPNGPLGENTALEFVDDAEAQVRVCGC